MSNKTVNTKILLRNDTAARWTANNPVLGKGEMGIEGDTKKFKFGDGTTAWNNLPYGTSADIGMASETEDGLMSKEDFVKLRDIEEEAQENVIEIVKVNGTALTPDSNKAVDVEVMEMKTASGSTSLYPAGSANPSVTFTPNEDGMSITAAGSTKNLADTDYVDENGGKIDIIKVNGTAQTITNKTVDIAVPEAATTAPVMDGTAAVGTSTKYAKEDHVHPSDTSKADKATTLAGYGITDAYTKTEVDDLISTVFRFKGTKATVADLPASGNVVGDVWHVTADDSEYVWTTSNVWEELGLTVSLEGYATEAWVTANFTKVEASTTNGNIKINGTETTVYELPNTVLESTDFLILNCGDSTTNTPSS